MPVPEESGEQGFAKNELVGTMGRQSLLMNTQATA